MKEKRRNKNAQKVRIAISLKAGPSKINVYLSGMGDESICRTWQRDKKSSESRIEYKWVSFATRNLSFMLDNDEKITYLN